jgi:H+/Cl- antiporter ClcA
MSSTPKTRRPHGLSDFTTDRRLLVLIAMAIPIGAAAAGSAWCLLKLIALITNLAYRGVISTAAVNLGSLHLAPWTILLPVGGSIVIGLMARYGSDKIRGHGIPEAIEAILIGQSRVAPKVAVLKPLSSAISIGTGGPFGAEGPIIMTGGAIGSLFAQLFHLSAAERKTLLVAGAAAGMTGVFGTPLSAILLAVELLLFEWKPRSLVPVATASIVAILVRPFLLGATPLFTYADTVSLPWWGLGVCVVIGVVAGLQSALMTLCLYRAEELFQKLPIHWMWWPALGGLIVGIGGYVDPRVLGVGYGNIQDLLQGNLRAASAASLLIGKAAVWITALASGTSGGVLAPLLIMGGALGAVEAHLLPFGGAGFWALLGMAAILGGTMRAPFTATLFAVELTDSVHVLPYVLAASFGAYCVTVLLMNRSILTERIARRGLHLTREYAIDPFEVLLVEDIMAKPVHTLPASVPVESALPFFDPGNAGLHHKSYPVVDEDGALVGIVSRSDILKWTRTKDAQWIEDLAQKAMVIAYTDEPVGLLADRMALAGVGRVPVLDRASGMPVGLVARRDLLRVRARYHAEETERAVVLKPFEAKAR